MAELEPEAKEAIKAECQRLHFENYKDFYDNQRKFDKIVEEVGLYKLVARILFVAVLGGSIFGIYKFQDYLDDRVAHRAAKFDSLYLAGTFATSGQYRNALEEIGSFLENMSEGQKSPSAANDRLFSQLSELSKSQREFFSLSLLESLSNIEEIGADGEFLGRQYWEGLLNSPYFRRAFLESQRWELNQKFNNRMANGYIRFATSTADLTLAKQYFEKALNQSTSSADRAANLYGLAIVSLLLRDEAAAVQNVVNANRQRPNFVTFEHLRDSFVFPLMERAWKKVQVQSGDFREASQRLFQRVDATENEKATAENLDTLKQLDRSFSENEFMRWVLQTFQEMKLSFVNGNIDALFANLSSDVYAGWADAMRRRVELKQKEIFIFVDTPRAKIIGAHVQGDSASITVRFDFEFIRWVEAADGSLVEGDRREKNTGWNTWVFGRIVNAPGGQWRITSTQ